MGSPVKAAGKGLFKSPSKVQRKEKRAYMKADNT